MCALLAHLIGRGVRGRSPPHRSGELSSQYRTTEIQRNFCFDECWRFTRHNPHMQVLRLLAQKSRNQSGSAADIHFQNEMGRPTRAAGDHEAIGFRRLEFQLDDSWFRRRGKVGDEWRERRGLDVLEERDQHAVRQIRRQLHLFVFCLLLSVIVRVSNVHTTALHVDCGIRRLLEGRSLLQVVIADQLKMALLCEDRHIVVDRSVFEVINEPADDLSAARVLNEIAIGNRLTRLIFERKKSVTDALAVLDRDHIGARPRCVHKDEDDQRAKHCRARRQRSVGVRNPGP